MINSIAWVAIHLFTLGLMVLAAAGVGRLLLRRFTFASISERLVFTIATGMGAWALLIFALGLLHLLYKEILWGLTLIGALGALLQFAPALKRWRLQQRVAERPVTTA